MTRKNERFSDSTRRSGTARRAWRIRLVLAAAILAASAVPQAPRAIEVEDIAGQLAQYQEILQEATGHLDSLDFAEAIDAFTRLLDSYKTGQIPMVTPDARDLVTRAYEGRALALANLGRNEEASADFEALVRFDPSHTVNISGISPKIVNLYKTVRKRIVGVITVETTPLGADVSLNDQALGPTPVNDREVVSGAYKLRVVKPGFEPLEEDVQVEAGGRLERQLSLTPNARSIRVASVPREVTIYVDGKERGSTFGVASSEYEVVAQEMGIKLTDISAPLLVENLPPGEHEILLKKECFHDVIVPVTIEINPENNTPVTYKPFLLEPSRGKIDVVSEPPGASVRLDGKPAGKAPLVLEDICSGPHDIEMEMPGLGRYAGKVEVIKDRTARVSNRLKLTLALFDLLPEGEGKELQRLLVDQSRYNLLRPGSGISEDLLQRIRLEVETDPGMALSQRTQTDLERSLKAELILVAAPAAKGSGQVVLSLYGPLHDGADRWPLRSAGAVSVQPFVEALTSDPPVLRTWSGLVLIDLYGGRNPVVLEVLAESPASALDIKPGDRIVSAGGSTVDSVAAFLRDVERARPGDDLKVGIQREGESKEVDIKLGSSPVLLPLNGEGILYNKMIADLQQQAAIAGDGPDRGFALANIGMALMHFGQWEKAMTDGLAKAGIDRATGISSGTIDYLRAICYERLGMTAEARSAYEKAASATGARLHDHGGPALASSAARRARVLAASR